MEVIDTYSYSSFEVKICSQSINSVIVAADSRQMLKMKYFTTVDLQPITAHTQTWKIFPYSGLFMLLQILPNCEPFFKSKLQNSQSSLESFHFDMVVKFLKSQYH